MFSGGKDSTASLIWTIKEYGLKNVTAVFCDTGWEHQKTYDYIKYVEKKLKLNVITLRSKKYKGILDLATQRGRFPSSRVRFCTEELKAKPIIDFILDTVKNHFIAIQGIRADESPKRAKMEKQCTFFKYYFEPYKYDKRGSARYFNYRKKDVSNFCKKYSHDVIRPFFNSTGTETIKYIIDNDLKPNPLYSEGFKRVGCFPCINCSHNEILQIVNRYPERIKYLQKIENELSTSFFGPDIIPKRFCSNIDKNGIKYPSTSDVVKYITNKNSTLDMFSESNSCMSFYAICE